jgi:hypothetical protein
MKLPPGTQAIFLTAVRLAPLWNPEGIAPIAAEVSLTAVILLRRTEPQA